MRAYREQHNASACILCDECVYKKSRKHDIIWLGITKRISCLFGGAEWRRDALACTDANNRKSKKIKRRSTNKIMDKSLLQTLPLSLSHPSPKKYKKKKEEKANNRHLLSVNWRRPTCDAFFKATPRPLKISSGLATVDRERSARARGIGTYI